MWELRLQFVGTFFLGRSLSVQLVWRKLLCYVNQTNLIFKDNYFRKMRERKYKSEKNLFSSWKRAGLGWRKPCSDISKNFSSPLESLSSILLGHFKNFSSPLESLFPILSNILHSSPHSTSLHVQFRRVEGWDWRL